MFRHFWAMHLYQYDIPMSLLSEWLGHAQMGTTMKYYENADIIMKQKAIEKATSELKPFLQAESGVAFKADGEILKRLYGVV